MQRMTAVFLPLILLALCGLGAGAAVSKRPKVHGVDVYVVSERVLVPKSSASLRVITRAVTGLVDSMPLPMADVEIRLSGEGKRSALLYSGPCDVLGNLNADFKVPDWPVGDYRMSVAARSPLGHKTVEQPVQLRRSGRILMVTDKPIYQPGQPIHMRALALDGHLLAPFAGEALRFEVLDAKGNKVFKRKISTNEFGIASTTFQLADEINMGTYQIEAVTVVADRAEKAAKSVVVKKYVLPKFKVNVETEKPFYLPKETVRGTIQSDYFFGKPVAGGKLEIQVSTFDVAFKTFANLKGKTGKDGSHRFEFKLPDYFVGQPLVKGDALVKLEVALTDTAKHVEKALHTIPVAAAPIRLDAVPETGRLLAGVPNLIYVVATYPDGSPARAQVTARLGNKQLASLRTDETGVGELTLTPDESALVPMPTTPHGSFGRDRRRFGAQAAKGPARGLKLSFSAQDRQGRSCQVDRTFQTDASGDRVLLRTDKAIYSAGDVLRASVLSTAGRGACYLDLVKNRQTILTRTLMLEGGRGELRVPLTSDVFGTVELHAYRVLADGTLMRDARVLYVQPPTQLKVEVARDKPVYRPGEKAKIRFKVLDQQGRAHAAALGVIVVDEAVYALQELKPGLSKVFFTLEKELSKPKYQIEFGPSDSLASLIQAERLQTQRQRVAKVLLAKAEPLSMPGLWINPLAERKAKAAKDRSAFQNALHNYSQKHPVGKRKAGHWVYLPGLIKAMMDQGSLPAANYKDPLGVPYTVSAIEALWPDLAAKRFIGQQELNRLWNLRSQIINEMHQRTGGLTSLRGTSLAKHLRLSFLASVKKSDQLGKDPAGKAYTWYRLRKHPGFRPQDIAAQFHTSRVQNIYYALSRYGQESQRWYRVSALDKKKNAYALPANVLHRVIKRKLLNENDAKDIWGRRFRVRKRNKARTQIYYDNRLRFYEVYSLGPDGKPGSADDVVHETPWSDGGYRDLAVSLGLDPNQMGIGNIMALEGVATGAGGGLGRLLGARGGEGKAMGFGGGGGMLRAKAAAPPRMDRQPAKREATRSKVSRGPTGGPAAPKKRQVRVRNFFPETLLFVPSLITDENGVADLEFKVADSITTWRMTASANGRKGGLGATSHGIRVFQDFFVDLDLPAALTQNDEVSIPVVVYNYLKKPQRVRLEISSADWFELKGPAVQEISLDPSEVSATYYRIRVTKLGRRDLQVRADGSSMSDAIRRRIEVLPDGKEHNLVANGRLEGNLTHTVHIPKTAVADASKILVRLYPGVFSQVMEGMESMLRLPGG